MKNFKMLVCDVDGTLAWKGAKLGGLTKQCLEDMHKMGILIGIASGRPLDDRTLLKGSRDYDLSFDWDFAIGMNGGDIWHKGSEVQHINQLEPEVLQEICSWLPLDIVNPMVFRTAYDEVLVLRDTMQTEASSKRNNSNIYVSSLEEITRLKTGKLECHYEDEYEEYVDSIVAQHPSDKYKAVHTFQATVEFVHPDNDKGAGLKKLCEEMNIDIKECLGIGDMNNDFELIRDAGIGVCMENGCKECKEVADYITEYSCLDDGFGRFFYDHFLNEKDKSL